LFERGYVRKGNIDGSKKICDNIVLDNEMNILVQKEEIIFQGEKGKILIQTMGITVCQFLYAYYDELFRFDYTRDMEQELDKIANNQSDFKEVCSNFKNHIEKTMKEQLEKLPKKDTVIIDQIYTCVNTKHGLTLVETIVTGGEKSSKFHKIKDNFTYDEIKTNQDTLHFDDLVDANCSDKLLGIYKENDVILKNGKFGAYICYNNKNIALSTELKKLKYDEINISNIIDDLDETREQKDQNILKVLNKDISIRTGKFGPYIFYKTAKMKKPKFININKIKELKDNDYDKLTIEVVKKYL
jgi:DNA topoisomerase-1